jgi:hypothetical protein
LLFLVEFINLSGFRLGFICSFIRYWLILLYWLVFYLFIIL